MDDLISRQAEQSFSCGQENDVISRKATIDALIRISGFDDKIKLIERCEKSVADCEGREGGILDCISEIEDLPSTEPEERTGNRTETHACDSISRKAGRMTRKEAIHILLGVGPSMISRNGGRTALREALGMAIESLSREPLSREPLSRKPLNVRPVNMQPRRERGRWMHETVLINPETLEQVKMPCCTCSECGTYSVDETNFCAYCGADMRA